MIAANGREWKARVLVGGRCVGHENPADCEGELRAHHVITQQALRKRGLNRLRWETENGIPLCELAHRRHHSGYERIPREALPFVALSFAEANDLGWMIDRYYPRMTK